MNGPVPVVLVVALAALGAWLFWPFWGESPGPQISSEVERGDPDRTIARTAPRIEAQSFAADDAAAAIAAAPGPRRSVTAPSSLVVVLRNVQDQPLAGVQVTLRPGERDQRREITGADGEVFFEDLAAGSYGYRIAAFGRPELHAAAAIRLAAGEMRRLVLRLDEHDRSIAGRVVDRDGRPVAGLTVKARLYRPPAEANVMVPVSRAGQAAESALDGSFEIAGLADGEYEVRTLADEFYRSVSAVVRAGIDDVLLNVVERQEVRIFGQVTDAYGQALVGASVVPFGAPSRRARTDEEGRYELLVQAGEEVGRQRVAFRAEGYQPEHLDVGAAELQGLADLRLDAVLDAFDRTVTVAGQVVDELGGPVAGEVVYLHAADIRSHYQAVSSRDGSFAFADVAASAGYELRVLPRGPYQDYVHDRVDLSVDTAGLEIVLEGLRLGTLAGQMTDPAGAPVPGFNLRLVSEDARTRWRQVRGDAEGYFELVDVPAGALVLQTAAEPDLQIRGVEAGGADTHALLVVDWGTAVLEGRVVDSEGDPVAAAEVDLYWQHERAGVRSQSTRTTLTDRTGSFVFARLGSGASRALQARATGYGTARATVQPGQTWLEVRFPSSAEIERQARESARKLD